MADNENIIEGSQLAEERERDLAEAELYAATDHIEHEQVLSGMDRLIDNLRRGEAVAS